MANSFQYIPAFLVLVLPFVLFRIYLNSLQKRAEKISKTFTNDFSELCQNLNVWVKNFDVLEKTKLFQSGPFQTNYDFYNCDLILNENNLLVIGKASFLGMTITLLPTIFQFSKGNTPKSILNRIVEVTFVKEKDSDLEIGFYDPSYKNEMILVIKRVKPEIKFKILSHYYKAKKE